MIRQQIFSIQNDDDFLSIALSVFRYQYDNCLIYRCYADMLHCDVNKIEHWEQIPFLPIEFFKTQQIIANGYSPQLQFTSSGTTGKQTSTHYVADKTLYEESFLRSFEYFVGQPEEFIILALLPSYLERDNSSLVYMVQTLISLTKKKDSGFYLYNIDEFAEKLQMLSEKQQKIIIFGVGFALLDVIAKYQFNLKNVFVFETGGMKGRKTEISREELHNILAIGFGVDVIYSEYGMTELLSQAYSMNGQSFRCPSWMKVVLRDMQDPFSLLTSTNKRGGINVIDLANLYSCSFIATQDVGKYLADGSFEVLGRFDYADMRGCNMLYEL
ncbi:MAG: acyltransferase [Bacteroidales bacterium]|jgi:phenylacetate-coenzyme A ligase PaaK-like adenylate-forming protein|nr:acyltransferase [Bacteroidales bacterium]